MPRVPVPYQDFLFPEDREKHARSLIYATPEWWQAYDKYMQSSEWRRKTRRVKARAKHKGGCCERCNRIPADGRFVVHHLTYENFMNEPLTDLLAICNPCHAPADEERRQLMAQKFGDEWEMLRLIKIRETFFRRSYGDDWRLHFASNSEEMESRLARWMLRENISTSSEEWIGYDRGMSVLVRPQ